MDDKGRTSLKREREIVKMVASLICWEVSGERMLIGTKNQPQIPLLQLRVHFKQMHD
jgi:hypothetical protein